jgi:hypothetical protein
MDSVPSCCPATPACVGVCVGVSLCPQNGMLVNTALLTFLRRLGSTVGGSDLLVFDDTCPSAWSSSSAGSGALKRCEDGFGCWAT